MSNNKIKKNQLKKNNLKKPKLNWANFLNP